MWHRLRKESGVLRVVDGVDLPCREIGVVRQQHPFVCRLGAHVYYTESDIIGCGLHLKLSQRPCGRLWDK